MKYKFVSSGQNIDDALVVTQTLLGNKLKPLPPVNLRGSRDGDGNLLITWTRRTRTGAGLRPYSDVPVSEEIEQYLAEILDGSDVVYSSIVRTHVPRPVNWYTPIDAPPGDTTVLSDDSLDITNSVLEGTFDFIEGVEDSTFLFLENPGTGQDWFKLTATGGAGSPATLTVAEWNGSTFATKATYDSSLEDLRVRFQILNSEIKIFADYKGNAELPIYTSGLKATEIGPFRPYYNTASATSSFADATIVEETPYLFYSADLQEEHFGSVQSSVSVRVAQISSVVGQGAYASATL